MNARALAFPCAISASGLLATHLSQAYQSAATPRHDPQPDRARTDYPDWPWPRDLAD